MRQQLEIRAPAMARGARDEFAFGGELFGWVLGDVLRVAAAGFSVRLRGRLRHRDGVIDAVDLKACYAFDGWHTISLRRHGWRIVLAIAPAA